MKYVPSALIGRLSRSAGSTTAGHNRFGSYLRNRVIPTNPQTSFQMAVRDALATFSQQWRELTEAQRLAWAALGAQITRTDSLGETYTLTGQQAFNLVNRNLATTGVANVTDAPLFNPPANLSTMSLSAINAISDTLEVAYTPTPLGSGVKLAIFASPGVSQGINFLPSSRYKLIAVTAADAASPANILTAYTTRYGTFPPVGAKIFARAIPINSLGLAGVVSQASDIVTAV